MERSGERRTRSSTTSTTTLTRSPTMATKSDQRQPEAGPSEPPRSSSPSPAPQCPSDADPPAGMARRRKLSEAPFVQKLQLNMSLVNSGSVARDHLASERTFLAYVRTSLAITSMGVALVQLFKLSTTNASAAHQYARPLGALTVIMGLVVLTLGFVRYFSTQHALLQGKFPAARITITFVSIVLGAVTCVVFGILVGVAAA